MRSRIAIFIRLAVIIPLLLLSCSENKNPTGNGNGTFTPRGMVVIPAKDASFQMGSDRGALDEMPVHTVRFTHNFWMDTTEVTQGDYDALMRLYYSGYSTPNWRSHYGVGSRYPAYEITWGDAALYCNARSRRDGFDTVYTYTAINGAPGYGCNLDSVRIDYSKNGYRLPTEAEWEFACRAGSNTDFFWGKNCDPYPSTPADTAEINRYAVWAENSWELGSGASDFGTHPVASKSPNGFGLYDIIGNLFEWHNDWYGAYADTIAVDPTGPATGEWHIPRGGCWGSDAFNLRATNRTFMPPDYPFYFVGFRVVLPVR